MEIDDKQEESVRWIWQCGECKDIVISYSHLRHDMNYCDCSRSGVDLEQWYCRSTGPVKILSIKKYVDDKWVKVEAEES